MNCQHADADQDAESGSDAARHPSDERRLLSVAATSSFALGARSTGFATLAALTAPNPAIVGVISASGFFPWLVLGPWAGYLVDRGTKASIFKAAGTTSSVLCLAAAAWSGLLDVTWPLVLTLSALLGCLHVVNDTALNTHLGQLVPGRHLAAANGRMSAWQSTMAIAAPALAGFLLGRSAVVFFVVVAAAFAATALLATGFQNKGPGRAQAPAPGEWRRAQGLRGVWGSRGLSALCTSVSLMNFYSGVFGALLPLYVLATTGGRAEKVGLVFAVNSGAMLVGVVVAARLLQKVDGVGRILLVVSASMKTLVFVPILVCASFWLIVFACVANGLSAGLWNAPSSTALIRQSAGAQQSHVIAAYKMVASTGAPLGALVGGALGAAAGLPTAFGLGLALSVVVAAIVIARRDSLNV